MKHPARMQFVALVLVRFDSGIFELLAQLTRLALNLPHMSRGVYLMTYSDRYHRYRRFIGPIGSQFPQWEPLPRKIQRRNSAGAFSFPVDDWQRLSRFLLLGTETNTYYAREPQFTAENAQSVIACIRADGPRALDRIVEISESGRAPSNSPAIFALALTFGYGNEQTRRASEAALRAVCRTGSHLLLFAQFVEGVRGWGRVLRRAVANWYDQSSATFVALQAIKYQRRGSWSHRDLLRMAHPNAASDAHAILYHWIVKGWPDVGSEPHPLGAVRLVWAYERAKKANRAELLSLIHMYRLPREAIPTKWLTDEAVWSALLPHSGLTAILRNLGNLTRLGVLNEDRASINTTLDICRRLRSENALESERISPLSIFVALTTYAQGHGVRGAGEWKPIPRIIDALNDAFHKAFQQVKPTMKRIVLAIDVSGSMSDGEIAGMPGMPPIAAAAAMAMLTAATEPAYEIVGFGHDMQRLDITPHTRIERIIEKLGNQRFSATDCALPILWALEHEVRADAFIIYTDSETWFGPIHPAEALKVYRQQMNIPAKLVVVAMVSNGFSIADPEDGGMMDVVGFDTAVPTLITDFIRR